MDIRKIVDNAIDAGTQALVAAQPTPMVVSTGGKQYYVSEGPCGFAWVKVYGVKGNTQVGKEFKALGFRKSYTGGLEYWVSAGGQSVARKEAFARAMAGVLQQNGFQAYADSRLD